MIRAELQTARELGEQCLSLAQSVRNPTRLLGAHIVLGMTLYSLGEFALAQDHLEQGIALYDPQQHRTHAFRYGQDPGVACRCYVALTLWFLGHPDQARQRIDEALALAQELAHPFSLALARYFAARLYASRREGQAMQEQAEALIALSTEQGFPLYLSAGTILQGWALVEQGRGEKGIAQMRQGLVAYRATGAELLRPSYLILLAEACGKMGQAEEGLSALSEALTLVNKTGGCYYEAELYRLKGQLTLQSQTSPKQVEGKSKRSQRQVEAKSKTGQGKSKVEKEAEECFLKAIEIARKQQAKSLELRAVMSVSRLWQQQGKRAEARKLLGEIYNWFTEGFDTKDLQEAKALLEELRGDPREK